VPAEDALAALRPKVRGRVACSPAVLGLDEVGSAYGLARTALHTLPAGQSHLVTLDDRLPESLLVRSPELARRLVEVTLRPVLDLPAHERDALLDTVATWLATNCSAAHAASLLYCHRNTVLNRLNRFEELTGQRLHHRANSLSLGLALIAVRLGLC
jgi:DNA-binding PucR family transcriptional regulator